ncbi:MAG: GNAT family N-acetyltransferase [Defluviitaleaceae bacterium]|nr:GNAT family N-acetyltransferase [Defluviitaleaceae bacterium]
MSALILVKPGEKHMDEIRNYRQEFITHESHLHGTAGLSHYEDVEAWIIRSRLFEKEETKPESEWVTGEQFMLMREGENRILGMINLRHYLNDAITECGGHIGYSIRPTERRKGYAKAMLMLCLEECRRLSIDQVLITCDCDNEASRRTVESCGGQFERMTHDNNGKEAARYWINLNVKKIFSIDLFAGIGGIRLGFDQAFGNKIQTVFISEWDEKARQTYRANFPEILEIAGDITQADEKIIPSFDICLAGFPCQAFSLAGAKKGFYDDYKGMSRGTLFFDVARICAYHKPKVIFCENVKGLKIHDKGRTFGIIKGTLTELGYTVYESVLNSKDYGVPQNRERIYIVAFRNDIDSDGFSFPPPTDSSKRIKDIIEEQPVSAKYYLSNVYVETLRRHRARHEAKGHGFGYEIRDWEDIAGAIVCGGMGRERNLLIDKRQTDLTPVTKIKGEINTEGIRKMTPREWARLQGYPDTFTLPVADVHLYRQFGNSVSVPVVKAIAENVKKILAKHDIEVSGENFY